MKPGPKRGPRSGYVMNMHKNGAYLYAYTLRPFTNEKGKEVYRRCQWGRLDTSLRFYPSMSFTSLPLEEKAKFIFPESWDLSGLENENSLEPHGVPQCREAQHAADPGNLTTANGSPSDITEVEIGNSKEDPNDSDLIWTMHIGATWLVLEWANKIGLKEDLLEAFNGDEEKVDILMSLVIFSMISNYTFCRMSSTQSYIKYPTVRHLTPGAITTFFSKITPQERSRFFKLWDKRFKGETCGFDSTSISTYSQLLYNAKWGYNKDGDDLPQVNFVIIYSLTSGVPIYYQEYSGNHPDCRGLLIALNIIKALGFEDLILVTDRGYETLKNIETLAWEGQKLLTAAKTSGSEVRKIIEGIEIVQYRPKGMTRDKGTGVFYKQVRRELVMEKDGEIRREDLRINVYYDPQKALDSSNKIYEDLDKMESSVQDAINEKINVDKEKFSKENNLLDITYTDDDRVESYTVNKDKVDKKFSLCGFYASKTIGLDMDPMVAHIKYKFRDEHEKDFYVLKDSMKMYRLRSYTEAAKNGRVFTMFIALILASSLRRELKFNPVLGSQYKNECDLIDEMMSLTATYQGESLREIHPFIGAQRDIADGLGLEIPKGCGTFYRSIQKRLEAKPAGTSKAKKATPEV